MVASRLHAGSRLAFLVALLLLVGCGGGGGVGGGGAAPGPTGLTAVAGDGQVELSWTPLAGASSYAVYWGFSSGLTTASTVAPGTALPSLVIPGLANGVLHYFAVTAILPGGQTLLSAEATATPAPTVFRLADVSPDPFARDVPTNASIACTFTGPVDAGSAMAPGAVRLETGSLHAPLNVPFTFSFHGSTMVLTPNVPLPPDTKVRVAVSRNVADTGGRPLEGPAEFEENTGADPDTTPPTVLGVAPANGSANVPVNLPFEVTFSEDVRAEDVIAANVTLEQGATPVAVTLSQPVSSRIRVTPVAPLAPGAAHRLTVGTGVRDRAGNALAAAFVADVTTAAAAPPARSTSFMFFVTSSGDSLETELVRDLNAWEAAGGSDAHPDVRMYAQMDKANATHAPNLPATPFHVRLARDQDRVRVTSPALRAVAPGDLTTATALSDFILACRNDFAAQRNVLVFSNHGMNYQGTNASSDNRIELAEIVTALTTARDAGVTFDVIVFDVCVMGGWENLSLVAPFANLILAGETTTTGMAWEPFLTQTFLPNVAGDTLPMMKDLVDKTVAAPGRGEPNGFFVYDCSKVPVLKAAAVAFYGQLDAAFTGGTVTPPQFADVYNAALTFEIFSGGEKELCDLKRLCEGLIALPAAPGALKTSAQAVIDAIPGVVVHARTSALWAKLAGVSAALGKVDAAVLGPVLQAISPGMPNPAATQAPARAAHFDVPGNQPTVAFNRSLNTAGPTPTVPLELDVDTTNGAGGLAYGVVSTETAPGVFTFLGVNQWTDDVEALLEWRWDGRVVTLSDGVATDFAPGFPFDFESSLVAVDVEVTQSGTGDVTRAVLLLDPSVPRIEGLFTDAQGGAKGPGRASLSPGDTLRVVGYRWNEAADEVEELPSAVVLTIGPGGLASLIVASSAPPSGTYHYGVVVEDPEGHDDEVSVVVTIP